MERFFFLLVLLGSATGLQVENVGVIHMHGFWEAFDEPHHQNFKKYVEDETSVEVHLIDAYNDILTPPDNSSITPLEVQVPAILEQVKNISAQYEKIIAVGYSQGGVIWRGMIESWDNHNVDTFISLASPQHGVADFPPKYIDAIVKEYPILGNLLKESPNYPLKLLLYRPPVQKTFAPSNYFLEPTLYKLYNKTKFFPQLNNEVGTKQEKARRKENFLRLGKLILIGGPDEDVVNPWQSEQFGYRTKDMKIVPMEETLFYEKDLFGLRTLDNRGGIEMCTVEGVKHAEFPNNTAVLNDCVVPAIEELKMLSSLIN